MPRILLKERGAFENADTGGAWLSSARAIRLPGISRRKVRMMSSHHAPYSLGDTRATIARTKGHNLARAVRALSHMDSSMCSSAPDPEMWIIQGILAWRTPPVRSGAVIIVPCTKIGGSLFLSNGEEDRNVPLKDSTETKMGCQERRGVARLREHTGAVAKARLHREIVIAYGPEIG
ncbi:hypothetical protein CQW23_19283 [Capsicum baccatum]|uniref:Uncharacterized protein n=1 Tax=Capsicum baccatum TaxID=33114 RepID=A0A2G2W5F1_CAPBA|nr:hypothetical protein CQW23_19283 [Capsicum baccatum]